MSTHRISELDDLTGYPVWLDVVRTYARCQRLLSHELAELGLSVAQHEVLLAVARDEGLSQKQMASRLLVTKSNVTALLERLENAGWVKRAPHPHDARSRCVFLTADGHRVFKKAVKKQASVVRLMTRHLTREQLASLDGIMKTVRADLDTALGAVSG